MIIKSMKPKTAEVQNLRVNEKKWSKLLMDAGWTVLPDVVIERQAALGLDAIDMNILVHLSHYWWQPENLPHPSVATIAKAIGVKPRTVQKHIKRLEDAKLIARQERRHTPNGSTTNNYSFRRTDQRRETLRKGADRREGGERQSEGRAA